MTTHGLTLGKYAPLHKGHQYVIETALAEMDSVSVIIYDAPETTSIPLTVRANWLRKLYPTVTVIEAWDGPTEVGGTPKIRKQHEDYILNTLKLNNVTHFYSSEFYGDHMSKALNATNQIVDENRTRFPISATQIRNNLYANRHYIDPLVYPDLITKVVFLGAPSTGKTTIANTLAETHNTVWMPEYGREYWEKHHVDRRLTPQQLVEIAEGHLIRESALLLEANRHLFIDTNAITTYMFAQAYHGEVLPRLAELATKATSNYDLVFVCDSDIPYDNTWDRSGDMNRQVFQKQILADLHIRRIPFFMLRGTLSERVKTVNQILAQFQKYGNIVELKF